MMTSIVGSPVFMAPEIILKSNSSSYTNSADIWSLGCLLFEITTGQNPFLSSTYNELFAKLKSKSIIFPEDIDLDRNLIDLIK